jgi:hypothetical protein
VRHRAIGRMRVLIVVLPKFNPDDEWFDVPERREPSIADNAVDSPEIE